MQSEVPVPQDQPAVMISTSAGAVIQKAIDSHRGRQLNGRLVVSKACLTDEKRWHKLHKLEHADTAAIEVVNGAAAAVTKAATVEVATASTGSSGSSSTTARRLQHTHDQQQQQQQQQRPASTTHSSDSSSTVDSTATGNTASAVHDSSGSITVTDDDDGVMAAAVGAKDQLQQRELLSGTLQVSATTDRIEFIR
jgi:hypothetical protein